MTRTRDEARVTEARRLYGLGLTTYAIAAQVDADPRTVQRWLGDDIGPRGPRKRPDVRDRLVLDLRDREGLPFAEIARRVHMSRTGVRMRYYALTGRERPDRAKGLACRCAQPLSTRRLGLDAEQRAERFPVLRHAPVAVRPASLHRVAQRNRLGTVHGRAAVGNVRVRVPAVRAGIGADFGPQRPHGGHQPHAPSGISDGSGSTAQSSYCGSPSLHAQAQADGSSTGGSAKGRRGGCSVQAFRQPRQ